LEDPIVRITGRGRCYSWVVVVFILAVWFLALPHNAAALTVDKVALLKGPDRQKVLEDGANPSFSTRGVRAEKNE